MSTQHFNAPQEIEILRKQQKIRRRKTYHYSRLTKLRTELVSLRKAGASYREITKWLRKNKRIKTTHTTVMRYLTKLPEITGGNHA